MLPWASTAEAKLSSKGKNRSFMYPHSAIPKDRLRRPAVPAPGLFKFELIDAIRAAGSLEVYGAAERADVRGYDADSGKAGGRQVDGCIGKADGPTGALKTASTPEHGKRRSHVTSGWRTRRNWRAGGAAAGAQEKLVLRRVEAQDEKPGWKLVSASGAASRKRTGDGRLLGLEVNKQLSREVAMRAAAGQVAEDANRPAVKIGSIEQRRPREAEVVFVGADAGELSLK
jgi:hypothetical protein